MADINGIDVSEFQGTIDWHKVKADGKHFAIIRAGFGRHLSQKDAQYENNMKNALAAKVDVGAYWFSYAYTIAGAIQEADVFHQVLLPYKGKVSYPVFMDWEYDSYDYAVKNGVTPTKRLVTDMAKAFIARMKELGWYAGYYTNHDYYNNMYQKEEMKEEELWLASYSGSSSIPINLQQTSSTGKVNGISGHVDLDKAYKDLPAFIKKEGWNGYDKSEPEPEPEPKPEPKPEPEPEPDKEEATVTGVGVRLRAHAYTTAEILAVPPKGIRLKWYADDMWGWSNVSYNDMRGWMSNLYLSRDGRLSGYRTGTIQGYAVNVRSGPSLSDRVITQVNWGKTFEIICILPSGWLHIILDGREGYLFYDKSYIIIEGPVFL